MEIKNNHDGEITPSNSTTLANELATARRAYHAPELKILSLINAQGGCVTHGRENSGIGFPS